MELGEDMETPHITGSNQKASCYEATALTTEPELMWCLSSFSQRLKIPFCSKDEFSITMSNSIMVKLNNKTNTDDHNIQSLFNITLMSVYISILYYLSPIKKYLMSVLPCPISLIHCLFYVSNSELFEGSFQSDSQTHGSFMLWLTHYWIVQLFHCVQIIYKSLT